MAPTGNKNTSSIARAFAGMTEPVDPSKPLDTDFWAGKDSFATVAARSAPTAATTTKKSSAGLPTPPNSISPSLPPQAYKTRPVASTNGPPTPPGPAHNDSDIDLQDAVEHAKAQDSPHHGLTTRRLGDLANLDAVGTITPTLLAKYHLPGILLDHGPLAIRHVMGYLTTSVPGFSGIPPAKARRLVVGALEGRGSDGSQGGMDGDVIFEKVGWGRWDARKRGQPPRDDGGSEHRRSPPPPASGGLRIPIQSTHQARRGKMDGIYGSHQDSDHTYDSPMENVSILEHEADQMSLDNASSCSSDEERERRPRRRDLELGDVTDEEDWASIGAAALRQGSFPRTGGIMPTHSRSHPYQYVDPKSRGRGTVSSSARQRSHHRLAQNPSSASMAKSAPMTKSSLVRSTSNNVQYFSNSDTHHNTGVLDPEQQRAQVHTNQAATVELPPDVQDREAVEALLRLSAF